MTAKLEFQKKGSGGAQGETEARYRTAAMHIAMGVLAGVSGKRLRDLAEANCGDPVGSETGMLRGGRSSGGRFEGFKQPIRVRGHRRGENGGSKATTPSDTVGCAQ